MQTYYVSPRYVTCPYCGWEFDPQAEHCPVCNGVLEEGRCERCHEAIELAEEGLAATVEVWPEWE